VFNSIPNRRSATAALVFIFLTALFVMAPAGTGAAETAPPATPAPVERQEVCMVTDRVLAKPQIPVEYDGKTYYGCCMGCVARLQGDRSLRYASDPVSGAEVDKAVAFITAGPGGEALYFESEKTAMEYASAGASE